MPTIPHRIFRAAWWTSNLLLAVAFALMVYTGCWEYSVRKYLRGFSDAVVPESAAPEQKVEAILAWMRSGPPRYGVANFSELSTRDPQDTLNYRQLLAVCGTATNAFLNLSRSAGLEVRRLLLLTPNYSAKHVVAEVLIDERWIIVDPSYRVIMKDTQGRSLTRKDLQNPEVFREATKNVPNYQPEYNYDHFAHVRIARIPVAGFRLHKMLDSMYPNWDELIDWSLLLERESFLYFFAFSLATIFFLAFRVVLAWLADRRLQIPRFHLREHLLRAGAAFFSTPEIKQ